jgi:hypothetical protein
MSTTKIPDGDYTVEIVATIPNEFDTVYREAVGNRPWSRQQAGYYIDKNSRGRVDVVISIIDDGDLQGICFADTLDFSDDEAELQKVDIYEAATARNLECEHPDSMMFRPFNARVKNAEIIGMYPASKLAHFSTGAPGPRLQLEEAA